MDDLGYMGGTHAKLNRDGEELAASLLGNLLAAWDTRQVDVAGLDKALCALDSLEQLLGEPSACQQGILSDTQRWTDR